MQSNKVINLWSHLRWDAGQKSQKWTIKRRKECRVVIRAAFRIWNGHVITSPFTRRNESPKYSTVSEILSLILCKQSEITPLSPFKLDTCTIVPTKECAKGTNNVIYINNGQRWCLLEWNNRSFHGNISKMLYLVHVWHWESLPSNALCHRFSICPFTDQSRNSPAPQSTFEKSLSRDASLILQSLRVVSNIHCSASRKARPSTCVASVCLGVATGTKGAIKPRRFVSRPVLNLVEPQPPALLRIRQLAWGHKNINTVTDDDSGCGAGSSQQLVILDCGLVSCPFSATDHSPTFKYIQIQLSKGGNCYFYSRTLNMYNIMFFFCFF